MAEKTKTKQVLLWKSATLVMILFTADVASATWCVARSEASEESLLTALNYACGDGSADCDPIQPNGLCYLPNTVLAHASYAFNSFYQRRNNVPDSCDFAGTATLARTDPSYGSCVYPPSPSTAGGIVQGGTPIGTTPPGTNTTSTASAPPAPGTPSSPGGLNPAFGLPEPPLPNASPDISVMATLSRVMFLFVLVLSGSVVGNLL